MLICVHLSSISWLFLFSYLYINIYNEQMGALLNFHTIRITYVLLTSVRQDQKAGGNVCPFIALCVLTVKETCVHD